MTPHICVFMCSAHNTHEKECSLYSVSIATKLHYIEILMKVRRMHYPHSEMMRAPMKFRMFGILISIAEINSCAFYPRRCHRIISYSYHYYVSLNSLDRLIHKLVEWHHYVYEKRTYIRATEVSYSSPLREKNLFANLL